MLLAPRDLDRVGELAGLPAAWLVVVHRDGVQVLADQTLLAAAADCDVETVGQLRRALTIQVMDQTDRGTSARLDVTG